MPALETAWRALREAWGPAADRLPRGRTLELVLRNADSGVGLTVLGGTRWQDPEALKKFTDYGYQRKNPAGLHRELWFHEQGDRSWLVITRNTVTHEITKVELARDVARAEGRSK